MQLFSDTFPNVYFMELFSYTFPNAYFMQHFRYTLTNAYFMELFRYTLTNAFFMELFRYTFPPPKMLSKSVQFRCTAQKGDMETFLPITCLFAKMRTAWTS